MPRQNVVIAVLQEMNDYIIVFSLSLALSSYFMGWMSHVDLYLNFDNQNCQDSVKSVRP